MQVMIELVLISMITIGMYHLLITTVPFLCHYSRNLSWHATLYSGIMLLQRDLRQASSKKELWKINDDYGVSWKTPDGGMIHWFVKKQSLYRAETTVQYGLQENLIVDRIHALHGELVAEKNRFSGVHCTLHLFDGHNQSFFVALRHGMVAT